jgi:Ankyrin repeat
VLKDNPELLDETNKDGLTPLHLACLEDKPPCVEALLLAGANANIPSGGSKDLPPKQFQRGLVAEYLQRNPNKLIYQVNNSIRKLPKGMNVILVSFTLCRMFWRSNKKILFVLAKKCPKRGKPSSFSSSFISVFDNRLIFKMCYFSLRVTFRISFFGVFSLWICVVIYQLDCLLAGYEIWRYPFALGWFERGY